MIKPQFDLGIKYLIPEWRAMLSPRYLLNDVVAGISVACIALPLSLAIALASGVDPSIGLVTAIVAGIVAAFFGGVPLAVTGPAAAMAILVATVVENFGFGGLLVVGLGCGILQFLTGFLGLGSLVRFVPVPVVMGFTAGIGAIIFIGQFPRVLGLPAPDEAHLFSVILHIKDLFYATKPAALLLSLSTILITLSLPRIWPRIPAPLIGVLVPSLVAYFLGLNVELVGTIPSSLPLPKIPVFHADGEQWLELISSTFIVYALASLETLLSAGAVDQLAKSKPHNPNQELIGQGFANIASSLFGGIPATAVIARSALNVHAGARTRRSAIIHAIFLIATVYLLSNMMSQIPIAVLAGLLITIAMRMCNPHEFLMLWRSARGDAVIYIVTFIMIVFMGLMSGIQAGIIVAILLAAIRLGQVNITLQKSEYGPAQLAFKGPLTFLSIGKLDAFESELASTEFPNGIIIDLSRMKAIDSSGASHLANLIERLATRKVKVAVYALDPDHITMLSTANNKIAALVTQNESQMEEILDLGNVHQQFTTERLLYGIERFKDNLNPRQKARFSSLAKGQKPHTLFITCSDSRIDPNLITSTQPGELFIVRNVGNIVPPFGVDSTPAEGAAIEYAIGVLNVKQIIVCSHSECGAMAALISGKIFDKENQERMPSVAQWLGILKPLRDCFPKGVTSEQAAKINTSIQIENLKSYPIVKEALTNNSIKLQGLFYNIGKADVEIWDEMLGRYFSIGERTERVMFGENLLRGLNLR
jgi:carbonic anhydrase